MGHYDTAYEAERDRKAAQREAEINREHKKLREKFANFTDGQVIAYCVSVLLCPGASATDEAEREAMTRELRQRYKIPHT